VKKKGKKAARGKRAAPAVYRRPVDYEPPYTYCDRWCERCIIDKSKCEVYQAEMDDRLHHVIDGEDPDDTRVVLKDVEKRFREALAMMKEKAKELGIDLDKVEGEEEKPVPAEERLRRWKARETPLVREALALLRRIRDLLDGHGESLREELPEAAACLSYHCFQVPVKLRRAERCDVAEEDDDEQMRLYLERDDILQAQIAHKGLARMLGALLDIGEKRPRLRDGLLEAMADCRRIMATIERRWLSKPNRLLEPVKGERWWGPLER
jgi:hypothetical protein